MTNMPPPSISRRWFSRRYGNVTWDGVLRGSGVLALAAIPVAVLLPASVGGLVAFVLVTIWVNGPLGMFLPATYEPILMLFGRLYPPLLIGSLGIVGTLYVEFLNYHLYRKILHLKGFGAARESRTVQWIVKLFSRAPFFAVWLCSWSPLPYWAVRIMAPLSGYRINKYLLATFLGRFPRLWFFAALGLYWHISAVWLAAISLGSIAVAVLVWAVKSRRRMPAAAPGLTT
jgi:uncharacterized membrane protein YdjX (TVP38/TMEM64 family)